MTARRRIREAAKNTFRNRGGMAAERVKAAAAITREQFPDASAVLVQATASSGRVVGVMCDGAMVGESPARYTVWSVDDEISEVEEFPRVDEVSELMVAALADDHTIGKSIKGQLCWVVKL